ncbi:LLM class flavin-dependent oxidoreductase [Ideonella livida]|uniref:Luciferase-like monooxygenase n=1 Tax=Ideonella livida TaxID=2707176 RepID=A0A7C9TJB3_9BURK|nr:LLM class flavin-dependent oxidoreductase [Ideonella livida]
MRLSVLDQSVARTGHGEDEALRDSLALATHAEALGYHRFWVSEHHGLPTIVGSAPEVLMAAIAARTQRLRIGSAGVMLPHYSAFKVAEQFRVLDALAPGRIDLGVGRAPGGDGRTARALNPHATPGAEDFPAQIQALLAWTGGQRHAGLLAHPRPPEGQEAERTPELWVLGSSDYGARLAAAMGLPYAFAWFFMDGQGADEAMALYHQTWRPSARHARPQATLCVWALVAPTADEARHLALSRERWRLDRDRGRLGPLRPPEAVAAEGFSAEELDRLAPVRARAFVGDPAQVAGQLRALAQRYGLSELVVNTWCWDREARRRSYTLLAQALARDGLGLAATMGQ